MLAALFFGLVYFLPDVSSSFVSILVIIDSPNSVYMLAIFA